MLSSASHFHFEYTSSLSFSTALDMNFIWIRHVSLDLIIEHLYLESFIIIFLFIVGAILLFCHDLPGLPLLSSLGIHFEGIYSLFAHSTILTTSVALSTISISSHHASLSLLLFTNR